MNKRMSDKSDPRERPGHYRPKELLRGAINRKEYTVNGVAKLLGLSRESLSRQLNGQEHMTDETLVRLCDLLHVDPRRALGWQGRDHSRIVATRRAIGKCARAMQGDIATTYEVCDEHGEVTDLRPGVLEVTIPGAMRLPMVRVVDEAVLHPDEDGSEGTSIEEWRQYQLEKLDMVYGDWRDPGPLARAMFEHRMAHDADGALRCVDAMAGIEQL